MKSQPANELQSILDSLKTAVFSVDENFRIKRINSAALKFADIGDYYQVIGTPCYKTFFNNDEPCSFCSRTAYDYSLSELYEHDFHAEREIYKEPEDKQTERGRHLNIRQFVVPANQGFSLVEIIEDITFYQTREEERTRFSKLTALETVLRTFIHEINNPLTGMKMTADYLSEIPDINDKLAEKVKLIRKDIATISSAVSRLQKINRKTVFRLKTVKISEAIVAAVNTVKESRNRVEFSINLYNLSEVQINGDFDHLTNVFRQLFFNSIEAAARSGRLKQLTIWITGKITVSHSEIPEESITFLEIQVVDNAGGVPENVRNRVFDPYFTTEKGHTGNMKGLGLFRVAQVIENHNATIEIESETVYTRFIMRFFL